MAAMPASADQTHLGTLRALRGSSAQRAKRAREKQGKSDIFESKQKGERESRTTTGGSKEFGV